MIFISSAALRKSATYATDFKTPMYVLQVK